MTQLDTVGTEHLSRQAFTLNTTKSSWKATPALLWSLVKRNRQNNLLVFHTVSSFQATGIVREGNQTKTNWVLPMGHMLPFLIKYTFQINM